MRTILFVCQFNSARSQLAEAIARSMVPEGVRVLSAGLTKTVVNTEILKALEEIGLDASAQRSKTLEEVSREEVDDVVVLAKEALDPARLAFPDARHLLCHIPDPIATQDPQRLPVEVRLARDRIKSFLISWLQAEAATS
ncbi:MAG: arsenate reductase ArsC [candidate division NC10 bacterium]